ncbi:MAG: response regulator [Bacteroidota bacterium]
MMKNKQKVLCVDDEPINLMIMEKILGKHFDIITAKTGQEALDVMEQDTKIEIIISDMRMPGMTGLEYIKIASSKYENKKYFMLSGYAKTEDIQKAIDSHLIIDYFQKPANFDEIIKAVRANS